jgi:putative Mg2+ transporter-C (MgtC) family protein
MITLSHSLALLGHLALAFVLAWAIGYERYFHGRAAGTQIYCLISMAACALTLAMGYPSLWYGGTAQALTGNPASVIGSILTGIGFLGAGIIVKSGTSIRGLTTAASIWSSSAVGILSGLEFDGCAVVVTALFVAAMIVLPKLEQHLPAHAAFMVELRYREGYTPSDEVVHQFLSERGFSLLPGSLSIKYREHRFELTFIITSAAIAQTHALSNVALELPQVAHVETFTISQSSRG